MADLGKLISAANHLKATLAVKDQVERLLRAFDDLKKSDNPDPEAVKSVRHDISVNCAFLSIAMSRGGYNEVLIEMIRQGHVVLDVVEAPKRTR